MKTCTKCGADKPRTEFHKDSHHKDGLCSTCKVCANKASAAYRAANVDKVKAYRATNKEKAKAAYATYYRANTEKERSRNAAWVKANPTKNCSKTALRRARKLQATPVWADKQFIDLWYKGANTMARLAGKPYHVDHVVPLMSELVCGLHVPANMQILPGAENISKNNRYWPDMP